MRSETLQTLSQLLVAFGVILGAIGSFGHFYYGKRIEAEKEAGAQAKESQVKAQDARVGMLTPERRMLLSGSEQRIPELELGDSGVIFVNAGPQNTPILKVFDDSNLIVGTDEEGNVKVSVTIKDKTGDVIAEIRDNEWKIRPEKSWDRNYSKNALEVKDAGGDIILQVRLVANRVKLQARLVDPKGVTIQLWTGTPTSNGKHDAINIIQVGKEHLLPKIKPIFIYPSEQHLGELAENKEKR